MPSNILLEELHMKHNKVIIQWKIALKENLEHSLVLSLLKKQHMKSYTTEPTRKKKIAYFRVQLSSRL